MKSRVRTSDISSKQRGKLAAKGEKKRDAFERERRKDATELTLRAVRTFEIATPKVSVNCRRKGKERERSERRRRTGNETSRRDESLVSRLSSLLVPPSPPTLPNTTQATTKRKTEYTHPTSNLLNPNPSSHLSNQPPHRPRISPPRRIIQAHLVAPHPHHLIRNIRHPLRWYGPFVRTLDGDGEVGSDLEAHLESMSDGEGEVFELVSDRSMLVGYGVGLEEGRQGMISRKGVSFDGEKVRNERESSESCELARKKNASPSRR